MRKRVLGDILNSLDFDGRKIVHVIDKTLRDCMQNQNNVNHLTIKVPTLIYVHFAAVVMVNNQNNMKKPVTAN